MLYNMFLLFSTSDFVLLPGFITFARMKHFFLWLLAAVALTGCSSQQFRTLSGGVWSTVYNITYRGSADLTDSVVAVLNSIDASLSAFNDTSLVVKLNRSAEGVMADPLLAEVFRVSRRVNQLSGGMFDPTVAPLVSLWGFGPGHQRPDSVMPAMIDSLLPRVGISRAAIDSRGWIAKPDPAMEFNFSAIAKGYACDQVAAMLRRNGVEDYMVEIGGEIALAGSSPRGSKWRVMVEAPADSAASTRGAAGALRVLELGPEPTGVATSGNYRNYTVDGAGRRLGHTISPLTGRPVATVTTSATVVAPECILADALATAAMAMEPDAARDMLGKLSPDGVRGYLLVADSLLEIH